MSQKEGRIKEGFEDSKERFDRGVPSVAGGCFCGFLAGAVLRGTLDAYLGIRVDVSFEIYIRRRGEEGLKVEFGFI